ncbi:MAG: hypothetical protein GEU90_06105 [Gemmatimonas sp.]|nr:hypothetical protein [Gemmatimonas sp.]
MTTTYRFEWSQLVSDGLVDRLAAITGEAAADRDEVRGLLARVFEGVGGAPVANSDWDADHRSRVGDLLFGEAVRAVLKHRFGFQGPKPGVITQDVQGAVEAVGVDRIDVNRASRARLEALPVIGPVLASRIEEERRRNGYFYSMSDLVTRVKGLGEENAERLTGVLDFTDQGGTAARAVTGSLEDDVEALLSMVRHESGRDRLAAGLEEVVLYVAAHPHPYTRLEQKRDDLEPHDASDGGAATVRASRVQVLTDGSYYRHLIGLLEGVRERVDVCMFYIALPQPGHPTHELLDALARKADAGRKVRVLVDQDGKDDPYRSHLINAEAMAFLSSNGVEVKGDPTEKLLHSKFVVIDESVVVIGSHNWTAGSFFHYADVSVAISGAQACRLWRTRFDSLWSQAEAFRLAEPDAEPS